MGWRCMEVRGQDLGRKSRSQRRPESRRQKQDGSVAVCESVVREERQGKIWRMREIG